jgi:hypothetical protein
MSRVLFVVLIAAGLALTVYFAAAAWRVSDEGRLQITDRVLPPVEK